MITDDPSVWWTRDQLLYSSGLTETDLSAGIKALMLAQYVVAGKNAYRLTSNGQAYYAACVRRPELNTNLFAWKAEVLSGIKEEKSKTSGFIVSVESEITRGALPSGNDRPQKVQTPEQIIAEAQSGLKLRQQTAKKLGITVEEFDERLKDGSIRICPGIGEGEHIGVFHRKGKYWRSRCRECEKKRRPERRNIKQKDKRA